MHSRFERLRVKAISMRRQGKSIRDVETALGIPRSTLSGWFKNVPLTRVQELEMKRRSDAGLDKARIEAAKWHRAEKAGRLSEIEKSAHVMLAELETKDVTTLELALAFLYLGEGSKTNSQTTLGSSDPRIAKFFLHCLKTVYRVPVGNIKCYLHLRADQNVREMQKYWSKELGLSNVNFGKASVDKRTVGRPTYPHYKGVCLINGGKVEIQRRLMYIANGFCDRELGASAGG